MDEQLISAIQQMRDLYEGGPLYLHVNPEQARLTDREVRRRRLRLTVIATPHLSGDQYLISPARSYGSRPA